MLKIGYDDGHNAGASEQGQLSPLAASLRSSSGTGDAHWY
jgi:hypothetical protein